MLAPSDRLSSALTAAAQTSLVQDVLAADEWAAQLTDADRRGLTPLFWTHLAPYGEVKLDMTKRLELHGETASTPPALSVRLA